MSEGRQADPGDPMPIARGLHHALLTGALTEALAELSPEGWAVEQAPLPAVDAADRLALHLGRLVTRTIDALPEGDRVTVGAALVAELVERLAAVSEAVSTDEAPLVPAGVLRAVRRLLPTGEAEALHPPLLPLLDTTLLTNATGEPRVGHQLHAEIGSADRVDVIMAFIRSSGLRPLREALEAHTRAGRRLRVLTTTYTGSTEPAALDALTELGAEVRVSYDTSSTRLHAKAWLFYRDSGYSTAYVGSSNLTHSAQHPGLEWNVRVSAARNPTVVDKIRTVFDACWESPDFVPYDARTFAERTQASRGGGPTLTLAPIEVRPYPFQARMLEQIAAHRARGHHRNLLVSATGTGKTVMAALDYASLCAGRHRPTLLFVAHRKELLQQALDTFRYTLRDPTFGELWVDGARPTEHRHVFASIQTLARVDLRQLPADHYAVVMIDEFHHAAAKSYADLLRHLQPVELLGLTATPERADGVSVLGPFDGRIAAELRLWDAVDQGRLCPFVYYGLSDGTDLRRVKYQRGLGYDVGGLTNLYTANDATARLVLQRLLDYADDAGTMRVLGFCVGVEHARFMARVFSECGLPSRAVWGETPPDQREQALLDLEAGALRVLFSVDLFNEGVDLPNVDTLLLLRPTESATLFLQQLGRGLRRAPNKTHCVVLDMVGQHRKEFRFDLRLRALLRGSRADVQRQVEQGFPVLPAGCHMQLDRVARAEVLRSLREALPSTQPARIAELRAMAARGGAVGLADYLRETGLSVDDVYAGGHGWSDLREAAGLAVRDAGPLEASLRRAVGRLLHVDDALRVEVIGGWLRSDVAPEVARLSDRDQRLLRMCVGAVCGSSFGAPELPKSASLQEAATLLWAHRQVCDELAELLALLGAQGDRLQPAPDGHPELPLRVHARYTRLEVLAAFGPPLRARIDTWQTGVRWFPEAAADVFAFTLDKSAGSFSPTTRYRDHAVSRELIHWESQSVTREASPTGQRYQHHARDGSSVHLFCRLDTSDRAFWYLGPAWYARHEGEQPMAITWRLQHLLPGDLYASFAAAVA